jgi:hypothetical protein
MKIKTTQAEACATRPRGLALWLHAMEQANGNTNILVENSR